MAYNSQTAMSEEQEMTDHINVNDRRVVRTRAAVVAAFDTLLLEKSAAQITVTDIAREANIDRKTFYAHFGSVDGLVDYILEEEMKAVSEEIFSRVSEREQMGRVDMMGESLLVIGETLKRSRILNKRDVSLASAERLVHVLHDAILRVIEEKGSFSAHVDEAVRDCCLAFTILGTAAVYRCAIVDHPSMSMEDASALAVSLVGGGLRSFGEDLVRR